MSEDKLQCQSCGCDCAPAAPTEAAHMDESHHEEETQFAVLLALVPAMTMTLFNMMGLL